MGMAAFAADVRFYTISCHVFLCDFYALAIIVGEKSGIFYFAADCELYAALNKEDETNERI